MRDMPRLEASRTTLRGPDHRTRLPLPSLVSPGEEEEKGLERASLQVCLPSVGVGVGVCVLTRGHRPPRDVAGQPLRARDWAQALAQQSSASERRHGDSLKDEGGCWFR